MNVDDDNESAYFADSDHEHFRVRPTLTWKRKKNPTHTILFSFSASIATNKLLTDTTHQ